MNVKKIHIHANRSWPPMLDAYNCKIMGTRLSQSLYDKGILTIKNWKYQIIMLFTVQ